MSVLRNRPKGAPLASFGFGLCVFAAIPSEIGYQDIAALLARQPGVAERWQKHALSSAATTLQVATFGFRRPIGTAIPQSATTQFASLDSQGGDVTGSITRHPLGQGTRRLRPSDFPKVERALKADRLALYTPEAAETAAPSSADSWSSNASVMGARTADVAAPSSDGAPLHAELEAALKAPPLPQYDVAMSLESGPSTPAIDDASVAGVPSRDGFAIQTAHLFFGHSLGIAGGAMERWQPGEEPMLVVPGGGAADPDIKVTASLPAALAGAAVTGESIASKGEVTGENRRPKTPAERLGLFDSKNRAKQEKCLANAVYFEARGEPVRGQIGVAQVVVNRAFSGYYPETVCGVVYQNAHRHLACQFTFACDGIRDVVTEPEQWERAKRIAKETLDGRIWLPEVGKSTHYHAYYVRPYWARTMKKLNRTGAHLFYRPRQWGDGSDAPAWGTPAATAEISAKLAAVGE